MLVDYLIWKAEYRKVWGQLEKAVSLDNIKKVWGTMDIDEFWWKIWGEVCDSYRQVAWAYLLRHFKVEGWERYKTIIDDYDKGVIIVNYNGEWRQYFRDGTYKRLDI